MALTLTDVEVLNKGKSLFAPVSLTIHSGTIATVMGPSGCGKSTLLSAIAGNLDNGFEVEGEIILDGRVLNPVPMWKRRVGILFQDDLLFPHLDVFGNLVFGLPVGLEKDEKRKRIMAQLEMSGLADFAHRDVATLSGGQKARVSLLRTLLSEPDVVLLDEPFSKLDKPLRASFREFVHSRIKQMGIPALLVTHDIEDSCGGEILDLSRMIKKNAR